MKLELYPINRVRMRIEPGFRHREWMSPHAYRCTPLAIANEMGWDIILPERVVLSWNGKTTPNNTQDVVVIEGEKFAESHFSLGTVTFSVGYIWRTEPGIGLMVMPVPNQETSVPIEPLTAVMETDKLSYPWFLTCRIKTPGEHVLEPGTVLARVVPIRISDTADMTVEVMPEPEDVKTVKETMMELRKTTIAKGWMKYYHDQVDYSSVSTAPLPPADDIYAAVDAEYVEPYTASRKVLDEAEEVEYMKRLGVLVHQFFTPEECAQIIALHETLPDRVNRGVTKENAWYSRIKVVKEEEWPENIRKKLFGELKEVMESFVGRKLTQYDTNLFDWKVGDGLGLHSDYDQMKYPYRDYVANIYLNDAYEGGELFIPELGVEIKARPGQLIGFHGGNLVHGVKKVTAGRRFTFSCWFHDTESKPNVT